MKVVRALVLGGAVVAALAATPANAQTVPGCDTVQTVPSSIGVTLGVTLDCSGSGSAVSVATVPGCELIQTVASEIATVPCS
ncbi:MAG TPA: hypothetical protein VFQ85_15220 [Mycobacteriales bacterium]|jgi:hypothetical protein|nr:hypothetical protein [Mycobacteriales bacterium]